MSVTFAQSSPKYSLWLRGEAWYVLSGPAAARRLISCKTGDHAEAERVLAQFESGERALPPVKTRRERSATVYVITPEGGGLAKVGWCYGNAALRLKGLQPGSPVTLVIALEHVTDTGRRARWIERALHNTFRDRRRHGEWFAGNA